MPKILIAEDDKNLAKVLRINLESEGFETILAHDGEETLEKLKGMAPDLLLLDIMLPKVDGFQVARVVRDNPGLAKIPIIVLSAKGSEDDLMKGWELGAVDYFVKPFNLTRLVEAIGRALGVSVRERKPLEGMLLPPGGINVAIVGGGDAGISLLKFLLGNNRINVLGVADRDEEAPGLRLAQQMGLLASSNVADVFKWKGLSLVLATKNASVLHLLKGDDTTEILSDSGIHFLQTLVGENEEREHRERLMTQKLNRLVQEGKRLVNGLADLVGGLSDEAAGLPGHAELVRGIARHLGEALPLSQGGLEALDLAARLHDIGKLFLPREQAALLATLPEEARRTQDPHAAIGGEALARIPALQHVAPIVHAHHERWDGRGFPQGLVGPAIPVPARILAVADRCALLLRTGASPEEVVAAMRSQGGTACDPEIVSLLPAILDKEPLVLS